MVYYERLITISILTSQKNDYFIVVLPVMRAHAVLNYFILITFMSKNINHIKIKHVFFNLTHLIQSYSAKSFGFV